MAGSSSLPKIGVVTLAIMNVTTVVSLSVLPSEAKYGPTAVFYYLVAAFFFLTPVALVAAELATGWPQEGGVYRWVSEAFSDLWGLIAIFALWLAFTIMFPSCLIYGASALAFAGPDLRWDEALAANKHYVIVVVLLLYWAATLVSLRGATTVARVAKWGGVIGTILPAALLVFFGVAYFASGRPISADISWKRFFPHLVDLDSLVLAAGVLLCYAGIEMNAIHVTQIENPSKNYPKAILGAAVATLLIYALGTLTIALILSPAQIDLTQGLLVTYRDFFTLFGLTAHGMGVDIALALGAFSSAALWISGPSCALAVVGGSGYLPPFFQKKNAQNIPSRILFFQGALVTLLTLFFVLMPSVEATFQLLNQLCTTLYLLMYILMLAAAIRLRYSQKNTIRGFTVPGGLWGMWLLAGCGIIVSVAAFFLSFLPPSQVFIGSPILYSAILLASFLAALSLPVGLYLYAKPAWKPRLA
ncbi:amino acid permease [Methylocystis bryophila]|nr:amino acid permease [Methylocystis bryophila]BDV37994.1 amino acid transporter [Methylocystis bryophila]